MKQLVADDELFEKLRSLRSQLAQEKNLPPYVIFSDKTLTELAEKQPQTSLEFLQIKGVGKSKLDNYGEQFLMLLKRKINWQRLILFKMRYRAFLLIKKAHA